MKYIYRLYTVEAMNCPYCTGIRALLDKLFLKKSFTSSTDGKDLFINDILIIIYLCFKFFLNNNNIYNLLLTISLLFFSI